uniref:MFS domain-containing protein n=1 Tax=Heterorhabditis bacteriophora TaxID=37862 RepID=A0A1I7XJF5_HETBA
MGDKVILTEVLEASNLTEAYVDLTTKSLIKELRHVREDSSVRYSGLEDRAELGEPEDQSSPAPSGRFTVDDAVEALGFGRFQIKLSILTGLAWMADAMEMMLLSLLSPALACEWGVSPIQQALVTTCVFSGMMLSSTIWGKICDRFGRRIGLIASTIVASVMGAVSGLSPHFYILLFLRGLTGFGIGGVPQSAVNAFSYYGMVLFTTVLFQSHDKCHGGLALNDTNFSICQPLTRTDYLGLLSTTLAEFPGKLIFTYYSNLHIFAIVNHLSFYILIFFLETRGPENTAICCNYKVLAYNGLIIIFSNAFFLILPSGTTTISTRYYLSL